MYCSKCGNLNNEENTYCRFCGNKLKNTNDFIPNVNNINGINNQNNTTFNNGINPVENNNPVESMTVQNYNNIYPQNNVNASPVNNMVSTNIEQQPVQNYNNVYPQNNFNQEPINNMASAALVEQPVQNNNNVYPQNNIQQPIVNNNQNLGTVNMAAFNNEITANTNNINTYQYAQQPVQSQPKKKKSKKGIVFLLIILLLVGVFILGSIGSDDKLDNNSNEPNVVQTNPLEKDSGTRTIMIYMIGSDLETKDHAASLDIDEIIESNFNTKDVKVLIYAAGAKKWKNSSISSNENAIFEVTSSGLKKVKTYGKKSAAKKESLTEFIDYVYDNYKSDLYDLILWNHGGGPNIGYGKDEIYNQLLSLTDINNALDASKLIKETKFELIGFDACLMASAEIANILKEEANYLVASEEVEPAYGWNYEFLTKLNKSTKSVDLGKSIVNTYYNFYYDLNKTAINYWGYEKEPFSVTLSVMDLTKMDKLITAIDNSFKDISNNLTSLSYTTISQNASKSAQYGKISETSSYDLVDLYDLVSNNTTQLKNTSELLSAIKEVVIYEKNNFRGSNGISIYFPIISKDRLSYNLNGYDKFNFSTNYLNFLKKYNSFVSGKTLVTSSTKSLRPIINEVDGDITINLPDDLANNYLKSDYLIFKENEFGGYFIVNKGSDIKLNGNTLSTKPLEKELLITNKNGDAPNFVTSFEYERDESSVTYMVLLHLENNILSDFRIDLVYYLVKFTNGSSEGEIIDIIPVNKVDEVAKKTTINLNNYTHVASMSYSYQIDDENGDILDEFKQGDTIYGMEYTLEDQDYKFVLNDPDDSKYYYVFRIVDTQGKIHNLPKVELKK